MTPVLTPAEALDAVAHGLDDTLVGALAGQPLVAVGVDGSATTGEMVSRLMDVLGQTPVVVVGVADRPVGVDDAPGLVRADLLLCAEASPPRPWVGCPDGFEPDLDALADAARRSPAAAGSLAQLLRVGERLSASDAVVAESWVYSLLQAGPAHREWLAARAARIPRPRPDRPVVVLERDGSVLRLDLDRPAVRNAYGTCMRDELVAGLELVAADPSIERVEVRGRGPAFCSGGDLDEFGTAADPATAHLVRTTRNAGIHLSRVAGRVTSYVHGPCVGAGVELPAFTGEVVARSDATFLLPEIAMGLVPGAGGTASIPRRIGRHRAAHLALRGRPLDVDTARDWGLVDRIDDRAFPPPTELVEDGRR